MKLLLYEQGNPCYFAAWWIVNGHLVAASESEVHNLPLQKMGTPEEFGFHCYYSATVYIVAGAENRTGQPAG